jgi:cytochrome c-type biogenesis protein CcmH/NrfG
MDLTNNNAGGNEIFSQRYNVLVELGDCHATVGNSLPARECYEQAAQIEPDRAEPYVGLGVVSLQKDDIENAETAFRVALRLDAKCAKAWCGLGMVCQIKQQFPSALEYYLRSLDIDGDNLTALLGLFQTSCQMGSFSKVIYYLQTYLEMHPGDTAVMFCLATLYMKDGKHAEAAELLKGVLALAPDNGDAAKLLEEVDNKLSQTKNVGAAQNV